MPQLHAIRPRASSSPRERGTTLVEVLIVLAVLGILSNVAIHSALEYRRRAQAARVVADFRVFRDAVIQHYSQAGDWPRDLGRAKEPPELRDDLAGKLVWSHPSLGIVYDWDNWVRRNGKYKQPQTGVARGFSVVIPRRRRYFEHIFADIQLIYDGPVVRARRNRLTFVIDPIADADPDRWESAR